MLRVVTVFTHSSCGCSLSSLFLLSFSLFSFSLFFSLSLSLVLAFLRPRALVAFLSVETHSCACSFSQAVKDWVLGAHLSFPSSSTAYDIVGRSIENDNIKQQRVDEESKGSAKTTEESRKKTTDRITSTSRDESTSRKRDGAQGGKTAQRDKWAKDSSSLARFADGRNRLWKPVAVFGQKLSTR